MEEVGERDKGSEVEVNREWEGEREGERGRERKRRGN